MKNIFITRLVIPIAILCAVYAVYYYSNNITNSAVKHSKYFTERGYVASVGLQTETSGFLFVTSRTIPVAMIKLQSVTTTLKDEQLLSKIKQGDSVFVRYKYEKLAPFKKQMLIGDVDLVKDRLKKESEIVKQDKAEIDELNSWGDNVSSILFGTSLIIVILSAMYKLSTSFVE